MKRIGICSDHAGVDYKTRLIAYLLGKGYEVVNFGTDSTDSCDYADFAHPMANAIEAGEIEAGIALCGTEPPQRHSRGPGLEPGGRPSCQRTQQRQRPRDAGPLRLLPHGGDDGARMAEYGVRGRQTPTPD